MHIGDWSCPDVPRGWAEEALNLMDPGWIDPLGLVAELWRTAWTAGHEIGAASHPAPPKDNIESEDRS